MKRKLLKQIRTEWRSNLWLGLELMIISVVLWYICTQAGLTLYAVLTPAGVETDNCFRISLGYLEPGEEGYVVPPTEGMSEEEAAAAPDRQKREEFLALVSRLKERRELEAVAYGSFGPYTLSFYGMVWQPVVNKTDSVDFRVCPNTIEVSPEYALVFRLRGAGGETSARVAELLRNGKSLITANLAEAIGGIADRDIVNMELQTDPRYGDVTKSMVGMLTPAIKRSDYEYPRYATMFRPVADPAEMRFFDYEEVFVRAKEGEAPGMLGRLKKDFGKLSIGNLFVKDIKDYDNIRRSSQKTDRATFRNLVFCIFFLMATVFLGLLGTFWFRTQQRVREVAVRKVSGATDWNIFRRLIGEGLLILCFASVPAVAVDAWLTYRQLNPAMNIFEKDVWAWTWWIAGIVFLLMSLMIVTGIWFPARKAMRVEPADILRSE